MYEIILTTWYQEIPNRQFKEVYSKAFETIQDAAIYLGENAIKIMNEFPVEAISIQFNSERNK